MTDKPNCSTCTNTGCAINKDHVDSEGFKLVSDSFPTFAQREQVRLRGCLSHPQAREYLMAPVIEELERKRDRRAEFIYDSSTNPMVAAYDEAINLIKGVK